MCQAGRAGRRSLGGVGSSILQGFHRCPTPLFRIAGAECRLWRFTASGGARLGCSVDYDTLDFNLRRDPIIQPPPQVPPVPLVGVRPPLPVVPKEAYTPWSRRFWALLIDWTPIWTSIASLFVVYATLGHKCFDFPSTGPKIDPFTTGRCTAADFSVILAVLAGLPAAGVYFLWNLCYREGKSGRSIGKSVMKYRVVREHTWQPIGFWLSLVRQLAHHIDLVSHVGYLMPLWDDKRQTIADKIVSTVCLPDSPPATEVPHGATTPASPPRKRSVWPWMVANVLFLVLVGGCGTFLVAESDWGSSTPVRGELVSDGQFQFVVTDVAKAIVQADPPPKGEYVLVDITVTNTGNQPQPFLVQNQK
jgi:uncharacterized RDD family membrane protein YckC